MAAPGPVGWILDWFRWQLAGQGHSLGHGAGQGEQQQGPGLVKERSGSIQGEKLYFSLHVLNVTQYSSHRYVGRQHLFLVHWKKDCASKTCPLQRGDTRVQDGAARHCSMERPFLALYPRPLGWAAQAQEAGFSIGSLGSLLTSSTPSATVLVTSQQASVCNNSVIDSSA